MCLRMRDVLYLLLPPCSSFPLPPSPFPFPPPRPTHAPDHHGRGLRIATSHTRFLRQTLSESGMFSRSSRHVHAFVRAEDLRGACMQPAASMSVPTLLQGPAAKVRSSTQGERVLAEGSDSGSGSGHDYGSVAYV
ncbi:hypothetical protein MBM_03533 [Drepanopeziza brunnea f. sp. 'multigermtubi' MB_m1]|uniref:Uncharacterized protein n=1 Tax=Marssonina brunnea f. sp. multigermtubi (strain MB_m1) TaxID=1072389 RepID=K1WLE4_MARBU|nr:uncharacterized protein MBM_03533 [Drepanopeziza brunnea f. sp. 'multigermtubi' MB_m1]EKD18540.1 hypothetical protein MBM_03533 [Drepanopeziza brunnea f. sp. 'multigermtubi' MB_m1]